MTDWRPADEFKIGLALSGGTLKAAAHVGILAALEELNIRPHMIAGTSAGSFVAALYAHGMPVPELVQLVREFPGLSLLDYGFPLYSSFINLLRYRIFQKNPFADALPTGLIRGRKLISYFQRILEKRQSILPYYVIATDLITGRPITFTNDKTAVEHGMAMETDDIGTAIAGSCSLPGIFSPVRIQDMLLVDGAFRHYVPVSVLRQMGCHRIIAVNLYHLDENWYPETVVHILARSFEILLKESIDNDVEGSDLITLTPNVKKVSWVSFKEMESCIEAGRKAVSQSEQALKHFLSPPPPWHRVPYRVLVGSRNGPSRHKKGG